MAYITFLILLKKRIIAQVFDNINCCTNGAAPHIHYVLKLGTKTLNTGLKMLTKKA